jgi:hypothetical protein
LGTAGAPVCSLTATMQNVSMAVPAALWSGDVLNDARVRLYFSSSTGGPVLLDRAVLRVDWHGRNAWTVPPSKVAEVHGSTSTITDGAGHGAGDAVTTRLAVAAPVGRDSAPVTLNFDGNPPPGSTVSAANLSLSWQGPANSCWWGELLNTGAVVATLGSSATPNCRASGTAATDTVALPTSAVTSGAVALRTYWRTATGVDTVTVDRAALDITWSST